MCPTSCATDEALRVLDTHPSLPHKDLTPFPPTAAAQGRKMVETFAARDDRLVYRSATYVFTGDDGNGSDDDFASE